MVRAADNTLWANLARRIFPRVPDFYALLGDQCNTVNQGVASLVSYMQTGDEQHARRVRELEHVGDRLKARNLNALHRAFSTPMDREDIFRAMTSVDNVLNYAKSTVREMAVLGVPPDEHTLAMAELLKRGTEALQQGFAFLEHNPDSAEREAFRAQKTERRTEKVYRTALAELFDAKHYLATLTDVQRTDAGTLAVLLEPLDSAQSSAVATGVAFVVEILKRREIYRHMSNAADRVAMAGEVLHDIVVKTT